MHSISQGVENGPVVFRNRRIQLPDIRSRYFHKLGKRPILIDPDNPQILANVRFALPALVAMTTIDVHLRAHEVSGDYRRDLFPHALHDAAKLMPQGQRRLDPSLRPPVPSGDMQIRSADGSRFHAHQHVSRANRGHRGAFHGQPTPRPHFPQRFHRRCHPLRPSLKTQSSMLAQPYRQHPQRHDAACLFFSKGRSSHREISSKTNPFVRGPITPTTTATKIMATARTANTAGTPCTKTAPIKIEVNAALNRLQLYVNPTPVARNRVGNSSA